MRGTFIIYTFDQNWNTLESSRQYTLLTIPDKKLLKSAAMSRWKAMVRQVLISFALPFVCVLGILMLLNLPVFVDRIHGEHTMDFIVPRSTDDLFVLYLLIPVFAIIIFANVVSFLRTIPPVYYDMIRGRKRLILFTPEPYTIADKYYVKTSTTALPFLEVTYEEYINLDYSHNCYLELSLVSKIVLGFHTISEDAKLQE